MSDSASAPMSEEREHLLPMLQRVSVRLQRLRAFEIQAGETEDADVTDDLDEQVVAFAKRLLAAAASPPAAGRREEIETAIRDTYSNALRDAALLLKRPPLTEAQEQAALEKYVSWYLPSILAAFAAAPRSAAGEDREENDDTARLDWLADKLNELREVRLERTRWEEGSTVEVVAFHCGSATDLGSSEPFPTTQESLRAAIDAAIEEEERDNANRGD